MTIILAIPAKDGLIIASDGQITSGGVRTAGRKIKGLNSRAIWAASGRDPAIQRVEEKSLHYQIKTSHFKIYAMCLGVLLDNVFMIYIN